MYRNAHINGVGTYHPEIKVKNDKLIEHFRKYDLEEHAKATMNKLGRNIRTYAKEEETGITMAVEAAKNALKNSNLNVDDIDMIISAADVPEYFSPCCALIIKNKLQAKNSTAVFDVNSNCTGMLTGIDIATRYLKTDTKYKRILITGSSLVNRLARKDDIVAYGCSGDGGAAIILEAREESEERGFLGSKMYTDDSFYWSITMPGCGMSQIVCNSIEDDDRRMQWKPFDFSFLSEKWNMVIRGILKEYNYGPKDVTHYFMSQFSKTDLELTFEKLETDMEKTTFVGDKYGYTGCTSPIMSLEDTLKKKTFKDGDIGIFCSVASGYSICSLIYKW